MRQGLQREGFLGLSTVAADKKGIRGSTLARSTDAATVTKRLLKGMKAMDLARLQAAANRSAFCVCRRDDLRVLRFSSVLFASDAVKDVRVVICLFAHGLLVICKNRFYGRTVLAAR